jgi:hypothetical protein
MSFLAIIQNQLIVSDGFYKCALAWFDVIPSADGNIPSAALQTEPVGSTPKLYWRLFDWPQQSLLKSIDQFSR